MCCFYLLIFHVLQGLCVSYVCGGSLQGLVHFQSLASLAGSTSQNLFCI